MHHHDLVLITGGLYTAGSLHGGVRRRAWHSPVLEYELGQGLGPRSLQSERLVDFAVDDEGRALDTDPAVDRHAQDGS